jgi:hypothetical protein
MHTNSESLSQSIKVTLPIFFLFYMGTGEIFTWVLELGFFEFFASLVQNIHDPVLPARRDIAEVERIGHDHVALPVEVRAVLK